MRHSCFCTWSVNSLSWKSNEPKEKKKVSLYRDMYLLHPSKKATIFPPYIPKRQSCLSLITPIYHQGIKVCLVTGGSWDNNNIDFLKGIQMFQGYLNTLKDQCFKLQTNYCKDASIPILFLFTHKNAPISIFLCHMILGDKSGVPSYINNQILWNDSDLIAFHD